MSILGQIAKHIKSITLGSLIDVTSSPQNLGVLQYNGLTKAWVAVAPEEINAVIDGGEASSVNYELSEIDGGGA